MIEQLSTYTFRKFRTNSTYFNENERLFQFKINLSSILSSTFPNLRFVLFAKSRSTIHMALKGTSVTSFRSFIINRGNTTCIITFYCFNGLVVLEHREVRLSYASCFTLTVFLTYFYILLTLLFLCVLNLVNFSKCFS